MALKSSRRAFAPALFVMGLVPVFAAEPPTAPGTGAGDLWEVTSRTSIEGKTVEEPEQTTQVCAAKVWTRPPTSPDDQCKIFDFKMAGDKATWTVSCKGPPVLNGVGEITRQGEDVYSGSVKFSGEASGMTIELSGHRVGSCDHPT